LKEGRPVHVEAVSSEPGLDRHGWESEWQALEPELADAPVEALPELYALVGRMLVERGIADGGEPELERDYEAAGDIVRRIEAGEAIDPGDAAQAILGLRAVYETILVERGAP
jgi:hypothetical protein